jgi:hypothetical protein
VCNSEIESRKFIPVEITLEARPKKYEVTASQIDSAVEKYLNSSKGLSETELADIIKQSIGISVDEIDPTPRCHVCNADSKSSCDCGELADMYRQLNFENKKLREALDVIANTATDIDTYALEQGFRKIARKTLQELK